MIAGLPWWMYILIGLIFFSGYMSYRAMRAEKELEQQYIEREGKVYIERIEAERRNKQHQKRHTS